MERDDVWSNRAKSQPIAVLIGSGRHSLATPDRTERFVILREDIPSGRAERVKLVESGRARGRVGPVLIVAYPKPLAFRQRFDLRLAYCSRVGPSSFRVSSLGTMHAWRLARFWPLPASDRCDDSAIRAWVLRSAGVRDEPNCPRWPVAVKKSKFTEEQIAFALKQAGSGTVRGNKNSEYRLRFDVVCPARVSSRRLLSPRDRTHLRTVPH